MIKSITVTNYLGDSLKLELARPELSGFIIKSVKGLGPGKATINTTETATGDGGLFNSARLSKRNIVLSLGYLWRGGASIEEARQLSYKYFPIKKNITLTIETDNRTAKIDGYVESNEPNIFAKESGADISIICPNPHFYSLSENTTVFSGIDAAFEFPFSNESLTEPALELGIIQNYMEKYIFYNGDADIGVKITIHAIGEAKNIAIYNTGTREIMRIDTDKLAVLTGSEIKAGDDIIICTEKNKKSINLVRDGQTTNILNCLTRDSKWFQLTKGDNVFAYTAELGDTNLQFKIENRIAYEGV